ncbi:hypothetical protein OG292_27060 [Streptomyces sp. NBC_01511]|uniref:hypothetical protein n=1 Tax=Streptomyces sp. NBC_01511 TaxID=2903889 RepID=UPI00386F8D3F
MSERRLPGMPAERVHIPGLCWIPRPGSGQRCTESAGHVNPLHFDCYTKDE